MSATAPPPAAGACAGQRRPPGSRTDRAALPASSRLSGAKYAAPRRLERLVLLQIESAIPRTNGPTMPDRSVRADRSVCRASLRGGGRSSRRRRWRFALRAASAGRGDGSGRPARGRAARTRDSPLVPAVPRSPSCHSRDRSRSRPRRSGARGRLGASSARRGSARVRTTHGATLRTLARDKPSEAKARLAASSASRDRDALARAVCAGGAGRVARRRACGPRRRDVRPSAESAVGRARTGEIGVP